MSPHLRRLAQASLVFASLSACSSRAHDAANAPAPPLPVGCGTYLAAYEHSVASPAPDIDGVAGERLARIESLGSLPHRNDGSTSMNRKELTPPELEVHS